MSRQHESETCTGNSPDAGTGISPDQGNIKEEVTEFIETLKATFCDIQELLNSYREKNIDEVLRKCVRKEGKEVNWEEVNEAIRFMDQLKSCFATESIIPGTDSQTTNTIKLNTDNDQESHNRQSEKPITSKNLRNLVHYDSKNQASHAKLVEILNQQYEVTHGTPFLDTSAGSPWKDSQNSRRTDEPTDRLNHAEITDGTHRACPYHLQYPGHEQNNHEVVETQASSEKDSEEIRTLQMADPDKTENAPTKTKRELLKQLSENMEREICKSEQNVENVNRPNRPMKIADDYVFLCSNQWLDAKRELDDLYKEGSREKAKLLYLQILLQTCYSVCDTEMNMKLEELRPKDNDCELEDSHRAETRKRSLRDGHQLTEEETIKMATVVQSQIADLTLNDLTQSLTTQEIKELKSLITASASTKGAVQVYVESSLTICWNMVAQLPSMAFECEGVGQPYKGEQLQDIQLGSEDPSDRNVVLFYVHPTLKHGTAVMVKGRVWCGAHAVRSGIIARKVQKFFRRWRTRSIAKDRETKESNT